MFRIYEISTNQAGKVGKSIEKDKIFTEYAQRLLNVYRGTNMTGIREIQAVKMNNFFIPPACFVISTSYGWSR